MELSHQILLIADFLRKLFFEHYLILRIPEIHGSVDSAFFLNIPISVKCFSHPSAAFLRKPKRVSIALRLMGFIGLPY